MISLCRHMSNPYEDYFHVWRYRCCMALLWIRMMGLMVVEGIQVSRRTIECGSMSAAGFMRKDGDCRVAEGLARLRLIHASLGHMVSLQWVSRCGSNVVCPAFINAWYVPSLLSENDRCQMHRQIQILIILQTDSCPKVVNLNVELASSIDSSQSHTGSQKGLVFAIWWVTSNVLINMDIQGALEELRCLVGQQHSWYDDLVRVWIKIELGLENG